MRVFAAERGCGVREIQQGSIVRLRFPFRAGHRNPVTNCLRRFGVWGQRCEEKRLPDLNLSREFWIGCLSGLIDTDGCIRERVNPRGTAHGSVEFATVSPGLAMQVSDTLLRLGVANRVRVNQRKSSDGPSVNGYIVRSRRPIHIVEISRATAVVRLAGLLDLRIGYKALKLKRLRIAQSPHRTGTGPCHRPAWPPPGPSSAWTLRCFSCRSWRTRCGRTSCRAWPRLWTR
ncbi:LAGLIDADG family homing endonuclease [Streptomyces griseorubiginosus]|uniref:LAGLIDADG family homing endonuclease n=1 Tax=Streptomyces griseorubiginosus TaxID=67304 RepID=UPI00332AF652